MLTPSHDHPFRALGANALRDIIDAPATYGVGERLDADAILQERASGERAEAVATILATGTADDRDNAAFLRDEFAAQAWSTAARAAYLDCMQVYADRLNCPHCGDARANADGFACDYCRGFAHRR